MEIIITDFFEDDDYSFSESEILVAIEKMGYKTKRQQSKRLEDYFVGHLENADEMIIRQDKFIYLNNESSIRSVIQSGNSNFRAA